MAKKKIVVKADTALTARAKAKKVGKDGQRKGGFVQVSPEEQLAALKSAARALAKAKSKADVVRIWQEHYLKVGHRKMGRLLLGKSPEDAMTRWGKAEE